VGSDNSVREGNMKKALVLYYTCSNNTRKIAEGAEEILKNLDWEVKVLNLREYNKASDSFKPDLLILGVPVHYWEIPDAALRMIRKLPQFQNVAGFVFTTFGRCVCNSVPYDLARELQSKGVTILGGAQIAMPHSAYIDADTRIGDVEIAFGKGEPTGENWGKYQSVIQDIARRVEDGNVNEMDVNRLKKLHTRNAFGTVMNAFSKVDTRRNVMPHVQYDKEKCTQCHNCVSTCDSQAITLSGDNEIVIDKVICRKCYKCIEECSEKALDTDWEKIINWVRFVHRLTRNNTTKFVV
jgi:ferredoxin/flavodoxin